MKVVIYGATGMVGQGVLLEALDDPGIERVVIVTRRATGREHPKLREVVHADLMDQTAIEGELAGLDACMFCLGVTSAGLSEEEYRKVTYDIAVAVGKTLVRLNPGMTMCFVSGAGTDSTEKGKTMWARVKGAAENAMLGMGFARAYMFRPGAIQPMRGIKSRTGLYNAAMIVATPLWPIARALFPKQVTNTTKVGKAMLHVGRHGWDKPILEAPDINAAAAAGGA